MKKKILLFALVLTIVFMMGICVSCKNKDTSVKISDSMFNNYHINISESVSLGIRTAPPSSAESTTKKNYLIAFDQNGNITEVVFRSSTTDGDGNIINQNDIDGQIKKMYVSDNFVYICYTSEEIDAQERLNDCDYDTKNYTCNDNTQSFLISKENGKIYSLSAFDSINIISNNIIKTENEYYSISIEDNNATFKDLVPNKNITVSNIFVDVFGTVFVKNNLAVQSEGNYFYYTSNNIYPGSDGYAYQIDETSNIDIKRFNSEKFLEPVSLDTSVGFANNYFYSYILAGNLLLNAYDGSSYANVYKFNEDSSLFKLDGLLIYNENMSSDTYILGNKLLVSKSDSLGKKSLVNFDLNTLIKNGSYYTATENLIVPTITSMVIKNKLLYAINNTLTSKEEYLISIGENGQVISEKLSDIGYDANIITIQPLN